MDFFQLVLFSFLTLSGTTLASSVKIVRQGDEAIVEMLGKYDGKKLEPGLTLLIPFIEQVAYK
jgi:regulator of protease activity HflC (stomatin/prohibitin superfamily)